MKDDQRRRTCEQNANARIVTFASLTSIFIEGTRRRAWEGGLVIRPSRSDNKERLGPGRKRDAAAFGGIDGIYIRLV
jgi:hypothetical protein